MPELPEVETTRRGISPYLINQPVQKIIVREKRLRWPVPSAQLKRHLVGEPIIQITRRSKYLLLQTPTGCLMIHLGMSGSLRIVAANSPIKKHDHIDLITEEQHCLRYHDPRRFGCWLWTEEDINDHPLLRHLGPEPLSRQFNDNYLYRCAQNRRVAVKNFIMNAKVVVGVGNIYANEALFQAKIHPSQAAKNISRQQYQALVSAIKKTLRTAIKAGGTTLRDFTNADGKPGYFSQQLNVYNREKQPCPACATPIDKIILGGRSSFYCRHCQDEKCYQ